MTSNNKDLLFDLGKNFYEWHNQGKLKFIFGSESQSLDVEIGRMSELIEYVKNKKQHFEAKQA